MLNRTVTSFLQLTLMKMASLIYSGKKWNRMRRAIQSWNFISFTRMFIWITIISNLVWLIKMLNIDLMSSMAMESLVRHLDMWEPTQMMFSLSFQVHKTINLVMEQCFLHMLSTVLAARTTTLKISWRHLPSQQSSTRTLPRNRSTFTTKQPQSFQTVKWLSSLTMMSQTNGPWNCLLLQIRIFHWSWLVQVSCSLCLWSSSVCFISKKNK